MHTIVRSLLVAGALLAGLPACAGSGCPRPGSSPEARARWEGMLDAKVVLPLQPDGPIAVKRDVHNLVVSLDARPFADAFHAVLTDPARRFGFIEVDRKRQSLGKPFAVGERFQGRYSLEGLLGQEGWTDTEHLVASLESDPDFREMVCEIENASLSDYGVITELVLGPADAKELRFAYHYLSGSPIAGSSTFVITQLAPGRSRFTQTFEYQEQTRSFVDFFGAGGLAMHNGVVESQVVQAAALAGGKVLESDMRLPAARPGAPPVGAR
jgi:hypothetical protein